MLDVRMIERGLDEAGQDQGRPGRGMGVRPGAVSEILPTRA